MSTFNYFNDVQAYEALETERTKVMLDPQYQQWVGSYTFLNRMLSRMVLSERLT